MALEKIHGINFGRALRNHDHDLELLNELTSTFLDIYGKCDTELNAFVNSGDFKKAERLVHYISSVSGSFGAIKLMDVSRDIEHCLQGDRSDIGTLLTISPRC